MDVELTVTDEADAALPAKISSKNSITAIDNAKEIFFDMFRFARCRRGSAARLRITGALGFSRQRESTYRLLRASTVLEARVRTGWVAVP
jgi:hypothetical protein